MRVTQRAPRFVAASISELYQRPLHTYIAIIFFLLLWGTDKLYYTSGVSASIFVFSLFMRCSVQNTWTLSLLLFKSFWHFTISYGLYLPVGRTEILSHCVLCLSTDRQPQHHITYNSIQINFFMCLAHSVLFRCKQNVKKALSHFRKCGSIIVRKSRYKWYQITKYSREKPINGLINSY